MSTVQRREARTSRDADDARLMERRRFMALANEHTSAIVADTAAGRFLFDLGDVTVGGRLFAEGSRSEIATFADVLAVLDDLEVALPPASSAVFVDVGANIGTTIVPAMRCGRFARGLAAEPEPRNLRLLRANLALNDVDHRVDVIAAAVGERPASALLDLHPTNSGGHEINNPLDRPSFEDSGATRAGQLAVTLASLDGLVGAGRLDPAEVGLVWIDAQGSEGRILAGARELTNRGVPLVVEFWPAALEASGGLDVVVSVLRRHYSGFVEVRDLDRSRAPRVRAVQELSSFADELASEGRADSDLLVLREPR